MRWKTAAVVTLASAALGTPGDALENVLDVGYSAQLFTEVDANDARAATHVWIQQFINGMGRTEDARTHLVRSVDETVQGVRQGALDVLVLLPVEFIEVRAQVDVVPMLVPLIAGRPGYTYGLLSRQGTDLGGLRGSDLLVASAHARKLPHLWVDSVLRQHHLPEAMNWFGEVRFVSKTSSAVLPVFFGDAGACIVTLGSFDTMREMNPQLGRELQVLAASQLLSPSVICAQRETFTAFGDVLDLGMRSLHQDPEGKQVLSLFGISRLVPYRDAYLDEVYDLLGRPDAEPGAMENGQ